MKRPITWIFLIVLSVAVHTLISWRVGRDIEALPLPPDEAADIVIELTEVEPPEIVERPPPEEKIEFEEPIELEPPDILIKPQAVTPPPPDVAVTLKADAGGMTGFELTTPVAALPLGEGFGTAGFGRGIGNALGDSSNRFAAYIAGLREAGLDVVFVVDSTGSMDWVLKEVRTRIYDIIETVRSLVPIARFGAVAFRDDKDKEYVTKSQDLTYSTTKLRRFLDSLRAVGGGDQYEALYEGVVEGIQKSNWRAGARQLIIIVGDSPPRPAKLNTLVSKVEQFNLVGGTLSALDVSIQANPALVEANTGRKIARAIYRNAPLYEFRVLADAGGGDAATLEGDVRLTKRLIVLIMGDEFAREMRAFLEVI